MRLLNKVPKDYGDEGKYDCMVCKETSTASVDKVWRCEQDECEDDRCQKCWNKSIVENWFKLQRDEVRKVITKEQRAQHLDAMVSQEILVW